MTVLALTVEQLLCSPPLRDLGRRCVQSIARAAFPAHLCYALEAVLGAAAAGGLPPVWHTLFDALPFDRLTLKDAAALLRSINARMPLPPRYLGSAVAFAAAAVASSPHLAAELDADVAADAAAGDGADTSLWAEFTVFFVAAMQPNAAGQMRLDDDGFAALVGLLCTLVHAAPALVDRVWYFLVETIAPLSDELASEGARAALTSQLSMLPWHASPRSFTTAPSCRSCSARYQDSPRRCT